MFSVFASPFRSPAARRSGIEGKAGTAAFSKLGMEPSLTRLSPFLATLFAQLRQQYGLDIDASLRALKVTLLQQTGDTARLRLRAESGEIDMALPDWWDAFADADTEAREAMLVPDKKDGPRKRRRPRRKPGAKAEADTPAE